MISKRSAMRLYVVVLFLRLFCLERHALLGYLELYLGGFRPMVGSLPASGFFVCPMLFSWPMHISAFPEYSQELAFVQPVL